MSKDINIYSNLKNIIFIKQILPKYNLNFKKITDSLLDKNFRKGGIIFYNELKKEMFDLQLVSKKYLLITNAQIKTHSANKKIIFIKKPIPVNKLRNQIEKHLFNKNVELGNLRILEKKLINKKNYKSSFLTDIEDQILTYLVKNKKGSKEFIKNNILNIKSTIETNSVESHLTRIRKKLIKVDADLVISSKSDNLFINFIKKN